jgi:ATP-dependent DNA helicase RecG
MGSRQSGAALLRFADLNEDSALLRRARQVAVRLIAEQPAVARAQIERWLGKRTDYMNA